MASTLLLRNELTLKEHCYKVIENSKSILKKKSHAIMAVFNQGRIQIQQILENKERIVLEFQTKGEPEKRKRK